MATLDVLTEEKKDLSDKYVVTRMIKPIGGQSTRLDCRNASQDAMGKKLYNCVVMCTEMVSSNQCINAYVLWYYVCSIICYKSALKRKAIDVSIISVMKDIENGEDIYTYRDLFNKNESIDMLHQAMSNVFLNSINSVYEFLEDMPIIRDFLKSNYYNIAAAIDKRVREEKDNDS